MKKFILCILSVALLSCPALAAEPMTGSVALNAENLEMASDDMPPVIMQQPEDFETLMGLDAYFSVIASGSEPLSYQWQKWQYEGIQGVRSYWEDIIGANSADYSFKTSLEDSRSIFRVVVSNDYGCVESEIAILYAVASDDMPPVIMQQPEDYITLITFDAYFSVTASGSEPLTYQWQKWQYAGPRGVRSYWEDIIGANSADYSFKTSLEDNGYSFRVVVSNDYGCVESEIAILHVNDAHPKAPGGDGGGCNSITASAFGVFIMFLALWSCGKRSLNKRFLCSMLAISLALAGILSLFAQPAESVPAMPEVHTHIQKDGTVVHFQIHGDEFLNYMTDVNGDLVDIAQDGDVYLARWAKKGENVPHSTVPTIVKPVGAAMGSLTPTLEDMRTLNIPIPEHLLESERQTRDARDNNLREQFRSLPVTTPTRGVTERRVLIIYVSFANNGGVLSMNQLPIPNSQTLYDMMFDENSFGTVAHYYKTVTNGAVEIKPANTNNTSKPGIIFIQLQGPHGNWGGNLTKFSNDIVNYALTEAGKTTNSGGYINYSNYAINNTITRDELSIGLIVHGFETASLGNNPLLPSIWAHAKPGYITNVNGINIRGYFAQGAYHNASPQLVTIGTIAHELGHAGFGFLDLYDTGGFGNGLGYWSLMASGSWGGYPKGSVPTVLDAYHLYGGNSSPQLIAPQPLTPGVNTLADMTKYAKFETSDPKQYFLAQPRAGAGYDQGFKSGPFYQFLGGVLFLLVDDNLVNGNDLSENNHFHVAVVPSNWNTPTAPYDSISSSFEIFNLSTKSYINNSSTPSSKIYSILDSYPTVASGWDISSITSSVTGIGTTNENVRATFVPVLPPVITTSALPSGALLSYYSQTISAIGLPVPTLSISNGYSLPPGLSLNQSTGVISGTPTQSGTFYFYVSATSTAGTVSKYLSIYISPGMPPTITTQSLPGGTANIYYYQTLSASGTGTITWSLASGSLPSGLSVNSSGSISGTPTTTGTYYFTVKATNSAGSDTKALSINIVAGSGNIPLTGGYAILIKSWGNECLEESGLNHPSTFIDDTDISIKFIPYPSNATINSILWEIPTTYPYFIDIPYPDQIETPVVESPGGYESGYIRVTVNGTLMIEYTIDSCAP